MFGKMKKLVLSFGLSLLIFVMCVAVVLGCIWVFMSGYFITLFLTALLGTIWYQVYKRM